MHIAITTRLKPFEKTAGVSCPLPGSTYSLQIFPSKIFLFDLTSSAKTILAEISVEIEGPVDDFTVQLNLEKGNVLVFGKGIKGYFRYSITAVEKAQGIMIHTEKALNQTIKFNLNSSDFKLVVNESKSLIVNGTHSSQTLYSNRGFDRLCLGSHKSQDWTLVKRRKSLKEIFPVWLRLGEMCDLQTSEFKSFDFTGVASILKNCEEALKLADRNEILKPFEILFEAGFHGIMSPSLNDEKHQGLILPKVNPTSSPLILLSYGAKLIRSLFATYNEKTLTVLPALPVPFHSGRLTHFKCDNLALVSLEWSKKIIRRMILIAEKSDVIEVAFQKEIKRFRLRNEAGTLNVQCEAGKPIVVEKGHTYYFDCFQK